MAKEKNFTFTSSDGLDIYVYKWIPKDGKVKGLVQIAHGMAETASRYERFAKVLNENGYIVYANDHRGHGKTAGTIEKLGYLADQDGFELLVEDLYKLSLIIKDEHPNLPLFMFGHSMGSFAAQRYIMLYNKTLNGLILSGSNGKQGIVLKAGLSFAKTEIKKKGRRNKSQKLHNLIFGKYNNAFKPNRAASDWLSRDEKEVDKYIENPYCGGVFTAGFFHDFFKGLISIEDKKNFKLIPKDIPIHILSGDKDPVGNFGKGVMELYNRYRDHGVKDLQYKLYKDGRHEMLNEINREEVFQDIVDWLNSHA